MDELLTSDEPCIAVHWTDAAGVRQQRQVTAEQNLVVGTGPAVDLRLPESPELPAAHALLLPTAAGIQLRPQAGMSLLLRHKVGGEVFDVQAPTLITEGAQVCLRAGAAAMVLTLGRRPRRVAPTSHLFPAPLLRPQEPLFHGTLSIFGAAALLLCGAVARADRPVDLVTVDEHLIASLPVQVFRAPKVEAAPVPVKPERRQRRAHGSASAASTAKADPSSAPRTTTLSVLGTHGLSSEGWTAAIATDQRLEQALQEVQHASLASTERERRSDSGAGAPREAEIGQIGLSEGGYAAIEAVNASAPRPREVIVRAQPELGGNLEEGLRRGLRQGAASVHRCYQAAIKTHPDLAGRLEVTLNVRDGRVLSASAAGDEAALDEIALCVARAARSWRFEEGVTAEEVLAPFVLAIE